MKQNTKTVRDAKTGTRTSVNPGRSTIRVAKTATLLQGTDGRYCDNDQLRSYYK